MIYKTPSALEMALRAAAKSSPLGPDRAIIGFYIDRLLCRIFCEADPQFVLKGGQGMIARTLSARTTRDIDLVSSVFNIDEALKDLTRLAAIDLDDFMTYTFSRIEDIKVEAEYREGYKVHFTPLLGPSTKNDISIDLVVNQVMCDRPDRISPKGRLAIAGLETFDYLLYPVTNGMADKICATMQLYGNQESSRIKDLVDLVVYLTTESFAAKDLRTQIIGEAAFRRMAPIDHFTIPTKWLTSEQTRYTRLATETKLDNQFYDIETAHSFVAGCVDIALSGSVDGKVWDCRAHTWK